MSSYINIGYGALLICLVIGIIRQRHMDTYLLKMLPVYLLIIAGINVFTIEYSRPLPHKNIHWIFNIYHPLEFFYFCAILLSAITNKLLRNISFLLIGVYCFFALYNVFFFQGFWFFNHYTYVLGAFAIVCMCLFYYYEILTAEKGHSLFDNKMFWIASGLMILYLGNFLIMGLVPSMTANPSYTKMAFSILKYLNVIMYAFFIVAFLHKQSILVPIKIAPSNK